MILPIRHTISFLILVGLMHSVSARVKQEFPQESTGRLDSTDAHQKVAFGLRMVFEYEDIEQELSRVLEDGGKGSFLKEDTVVPEDLRSKYHSAMKSITEDYPWSRLELHRSGRWHAKPISRRLRRDLQTGNYVNLEYLEDSEPELRMTQGNMLFPTLLICSLQFMNNLESQQSGLMLSVHEGHDHEENDHHFQPENDEQQLRSLNI